LPKKVNKINKSRQRALTTAQHNTFTVLLLLMSAHRFIVLKMLSSTPSAFATIRTGWATLASLNAG
jgi:hypothetical protein